MRLWRQLERRVRAALDNRTATATATEADIQEAIDRVLSLDAACPLPLFDKFPSTIEPTRWWPRRKPPAQLAKTINVGAWRCAMSGNG